MLTHERAHTHAQTHTYSNTEAFECTEMLQDKTWTTQADWFAVASTIHCLLHNEYMAVELSSNTAGVTSAAPKLPLKRYWKVRAECISELRESRARDGQEAQTLVSQFMSR